MPNANDDIFITINASENENKIFQILLLKYAKNKLALIIRLLQLESNPQMLLKALDSNGEDFSDILDTSGDIENIFNYFNFLLSHVSSFTSLTIIN